MTDRLRKGTDRFSIFLFFLLVIGCAPCYGGNRGLPAQEGVLNFGKVAEGIYRGAEPDTAAVKNLQQLGIKTIIDLRKPGQVRKAEAVEAQAAGILYTNVSMPGLSRPTDAQVNNVLVLMDTLPKPLFLHCQHGCDRTGTIIACYRIQHDKWTHETAWQEAVRYGISRLERGMRKYVSDFSRVPLKVAKTESPIVR